MHHGIIWWPKYGAREIWCRSLEKHNLRYTIYIGDYDSSCHKGLLEARPYGDTEVKKSDYMCWPCMYR
jgi:hypothetical protein